MAKNNKKEKDDKNQKITKYFIEDIERITFQLAKEKEKNENLQKKIKKLDTDNNNLYNKIESIQIELAKEKEKNEINEKKLNEKDLIEKTISDYKHEIEDYKKQIEDYKKQIEDNKKEKRNKIKNFEDNQKEIENYQYEIKNYQKEIEELKEKLAILLPFKLSKGDKIISVNFKSGDQAVNYSILCKNSHKFDYLLENLYEKYPNYKNIKDSIYFLANGVKVDTLKTLDENNIKDNDIILINQNSTSMMMSLF